MTRFVQRNHGRWPCRIISSLIVFCFVFTTIIPPQVSFAQTITPIGVGLPAPGTMVHISPGFTPTLIKGITIHPDNPLEFDFILDTGDSKLKDEALKEESNRLVRYFLAALTVPDSDLWVNLSPYESQRILPDSLSQTEMGRDLLSQDYILKQLTASLMYPEDELGKKFWKRVFKKAQERFGSTDIPVNTFNKVWIIPDDALVIEYKNSAFVAKSHLKVMLEEDYLATQEAENIQNPKARISETSDLSNQIVREVLIPEIEREVNQGENFANLRQIFDAMILSTWYKQNLKETLLSRVYVNQSKTPGIDLADRSIKEKIYNQYIEAFRKGVYNYIREDYDEAKKELIPRKYFSGGTRHVPEAIRKIRIRDDLPADRAAQAMLGYIPAQDRAEARKNLLARGTLVRAKYGLREISRDLEETPAQEPIVNRAMLAKLDVNEQGLGTISINLPKSQALTYDHIERLIELVDEAESNGNIKALVFDGGKNLGAGADIFEILRNRMQPENAEKSIKFYEREKVLHEKIAASKKPTIALAKGVTMGGAMGIAAATDFIITDDTTRIAMPEVKIGFIPDVGGTWFLPRRMGVSAAKYYGLTGHSMNGKEATGLGLAQGYVENISQFEKTLNNVLGEKGEVTKADILDAIENAGQTSAALSLEIEELSQKVAKYFDYGQHNKGYLGDIYTELEKGAREGDEFARKALASMRSASAQSVFLTEFLIDTFAQEGLYTQEEAREAELKFAQEMTGTVHYMEGVLGLKKGFVSGKFDNNLDTIVLTDSKGFRREIAATRTDTGSELNEDVEIDYEGGTYTLKAGKFHSGETQVTLNNGDGTKTATLRLALRNSQWSDQQVVDELGVIRALMETKMGWRLTRRAWLTNPEKFELDMVYPYAWQERPGVALDMTNHPANRRYTDGKINPARAIFDQLRAQGEHLLDERKVTRIGEDQDGAGRNTDVVEYTYRQIEQDANRMANVLWEMGVRPGDTVLIYMSTNYEGMIAQLASTLVGATYHFQFAAKGADILSDTIHHLGAKIIITEDGYQITGGKSSPLMKQAVNPVLTRYMPKSEFEKRLEAALAGLDSSLSEEASLIKEKIDERLSTKVTYSRDAMKEFLKEIYEEHIKYTVLGALDAEQEAELKEAQKTRNKAIEKAERKVQSARNNERAFEAHMGILRDALLQVKPDADIYIAESDLSAEQKEAIERTVAERGDPEAEYDFEHLLDVNKFAQALLENWREVLDAADDMESGGYEGLFLVEKDGKKGLVHVKIDGAKGIEFRKRTWIKTYLRSIVNKKPAPTLEALLTKEQRLSDSDFIIAFAKSKGIGQDKLATIDRLAKVRKRVLAEFEKPYERDEKLIVFNRLEKLGLDTAPVVAGRDTLWDDAIKQIERKLSAQGRDITEFEAVSMDGSHPAFLVYSSGSTGAPKGIMLQTGSIVAGGQTMQNAFGLAEHDMHHTSTDYGWIVGPAYALWFPMMEGRSFTLQSFAPTPQRLAQVVDEYDIDFLKAGSPVIEMMAKEPGLFEKWDLSSLNRPGAPGCYGCAAPYTYPTHQRVQATLGDIANNGVWRSEDFGAQHATFKRRPEVERRSHDTYGEELKRLLGDEAYTELQEKYNRLLLETEGEREDKKDGEEDYWGLFSHLRTPIHINKEHPDQLAFPWVNPVITEPLEDSEGNIADDPKVVTDALIVGGEQRTKKAAIGQLSYAGSAPQRMVGLMASNDGQKGPARYDDDLTAKKYFGHKYKTDFPGKGREGVRTVHDGGDSAYWVRVYYDETDPFDSLILAGETDPVTPRTLYASGRAGNVANVNGHLVNETMYENVLNDVKGVKKVGVTFIDHAVREKTPVVYVSLKPGVQPSQDLIDEVLRVTGNIHAQVKPLVQDIIFSPAEADGFTADETYLPMTLTAKIMYELIKFFAAKPLETLLQMQELLNNEDAIEAVRGGKIDIFKQNEVFDGMPNIDGLKFKASLINLLNRIIATREGDKIVIADFDPESPTAEPFESVPADQIKRLGTPLLRPGIDPVPPYQEAYGIARNEQGVRIIGKPEVAFRKFIRETPKVGGGQVLVQMISAGATYNVINGITDDPINVLGEKPHHVLGDAAVAQILELSPEAEAEGRLAVGQIVIVDPEVFNRHASTVSLDIQREGHIGGYQGGQDQATLQAFAAFDAGNLYEPPAGMKLSLAGTLLLDGPTVERALFNPKKLNVKPGDVVLVHGGSGHTGGMAIDMLTPLGVKIVTYVRDEKTADLVRSRHPNADIHFILRSEHRDAMTPVPVHSEKPFNGIAPELADRMLRIARGQLRSGFSARSVTTPPPSTPEDIESLITYALEQTDQVLGEIAAEELDSTPVERIMGTPIEKILREYLRGLDPKTGDPANQAMLSEDEAKKLLTGEAKLPTAQEEWLGHLERLLGSIPDEFRPTKIMQFAGSGSNAVDFRLLKPSERGSRIAWYSGAFGLYGTLLGHNATLDAQTALGEAGADVTLGSQVLIHYGADADETGKDDTAIEAMKEAARLGGHVTVLTETNTQQSYILSHDNLADIVGATRIISVEAMQGGEVGAKLQWPEHLPDIDEGRWDPNRNPYHPWPGLEAQSRYTTQTVSIVKKGVGRFNNNMNALWDVIWDNGKRDHLALNIALLQQQTGRVVYGKTSSDQILTYSLAQGWMVQRELILPSDLASDSSQPANRRLFRLTGSHMYEPHEARQHLDRYEQDIYKAHGPDRVLDADDIPQGFQDQLDGSAPGSTAYRMATGLNGQPLDDIITDRDLLLAQGADIVEELSFMRLYTHEVAPGKKIATVEFKTNSPKKTNKARNQDLHWFRGDAVKQIRKLMALAAKDPDIKNVVLSAESTRAFNPGQNSDELMTMSPDQIEEMAAAAQEAMAYIESMRKPVVLNLSGLALGGGSELAAAAHYIVASNIDRTYLGQPETFINLIPGFGGTQRLVRIMADNSRFGQRNGLLYAADTVITGQPIPIEDAYLHGFVSELVPANSVNRAYQLAAGHALGTDDTLKKAMEARHAAMERWESPMIDEETGEPMRAEVLTEDEHIQAYLKHGREVGRRGDVYELALELMVENVTEGVNYAEEAYAFGQAGSSSEFRAAIARFRSKVPIERPLRRNKTYGELERSRLTRHTGEDPGPQDVQSTKLPGQPKHEIPDRDIRVLSVTPDLSEAEVQLIGDTLRTFHDDDFAVQVMGEKGDAGQIFDITESHINTIDPAQTLRELEAQTKQRINVWRPDGSRERASLISRFGKRGIHLSPGGGMAAVIYDAATDSFNIYIPIRQLHFLTRTSADARRQFAARVRALIEDMQRGRKRSEAELASEAPINTLLSDFKTAQKAHEKALRDRKPGIYKGQIVLVAGASGEMGTDETAHLLEEGATVIFTGRTIVNLRSAIAKYVELGFEPERMEAVAIDNTNQQQIEEGMAKVAEFAKKVKGSEDAKIDHVVIVAGTTGPIRDIGNTPVDTNVDENLQKSVDNLFIGDILLAQEAVKIMVPGGSVNIVSTIFSRTNYHSRIGYVSPKSALRPLFDAVRIDLGRRLGVRVNIIYPGGLTGPRIKGAWTLMDSNRGVPSGTTAAEFFNTMRIQAGFIPYRHATRAIDFIMSDEASSLNGGLETTFGMDIELESKTTLFEYLDTDQLQHRDDAIMIWGGADRDILRKAIAGFKKTSSKHIFVVVPDEVTKRAFLADAVDPKIELIVARSDNADDVHRAFEHVERKYQAPQVILSLPQFALPAKRWYDIKNAKEWERYGLQHLSSQELIAREAVILGAKPRNENKKIQLIFMRPDVDNELAASAVASTEALTRQIRHEEKSAVANHRKTAPIIPYQLVTNGAGDEIDFLLDYALSLSVRNPQISFDAINLYGPSTEEAYRKQMLQRSQTANKAMLAIDTQMASVYEELAADLAARQAANTKHKDGKKLAGKLAVITGAAGEIGQATTRRFLQEGAEVVLVGRNTGNNLFNLQINLIEEEGIDAKRIHVVPADLSDKDEVDNAVQRIKKLGEIDVLFNNAATAGPKESLEELPFGDYDGENILQAIDNIFTGNWRFTKGLAPNLAEGASVINNTTIFLLLDYFSNIGYVVPKAAFEGFTEELAWELGRSGKNIRVNELMPGPIDTERIRSVFAAMAEKAGVNPESVANEFLEMMAVQKGFPKTSEVANAVVFLASEASAAIAGHKIEVTNGMLVEHESKTTLPKRPQIPKRFQTGEKQALTVYGADRVLPKFEPTTSLKGKNIVFVGGFGKGQEKTSLSLAGANVFEAPDVADEDGFLAWVNKTFTSKGEEIYAFVYNNDDVKERGAQANIPEGKLMDIDDTTLDIFIDDYIARAMQFAKLSAKVLRQIRKNNDKPKILFLSPHKKTAFSRIVVKATESLIRQMRHDQEVTTIKDDPSARTLNTDIYQIVSTEDDDLSDRSAWVGNLLLDTLGKPKAVNLYQQDAARRLHEPRGTAKATHKPGNTMSEYYQKMKAKKFLHIDTETDHGPFRDANGERQVLAITGGSRGIGKATALAFLLGGGNVSMFARNEADMRDNILELLEVPEFTEQVIDDIRERTNGHYPTEQVEESIDLLRTILAAFNRYQQEIKAIKKKYAALIEEAQQEAETYLEKRERELAFIEDSRREKHEINARFREELGLDNPQDGELVTIRDIADYFDEHILEFDQDRLFEDRVLITSGTVESESDILRWRDKTKAKFGRVDHVGNNAGATGQTMPVVRIPPGVNLELVPVKRKEGDAAINKLTDEELAQFPGVPGTDLMGYIETFEGNNIAAIRVKKAFLPMMREQTGNRTMWDTTSLFGSERYPDRSQYAMGKNGLEGLDAITWDGEMSFLANGIRQWTVGPATVWGTRLKPADLEDDPTGQWRGLFMKRVEAQWMKGVATTEAGLKKKIASLFKHSGHYTEEVDVAEDIYEGMINEAYANQKRTPASGFRLDQRDDHYGLDPKGPSPEELVQLKGKVVYISGELFSEGLKNTIRTYLANGANVIIHTRTEEAKDELVDQFGNYDLYQHDATLTVENRGDLTKKAKEVNMGDSRINEVILGGIREEGDSIVRETNDGTGFKTVTGKFEGFKRLDIVISAPLYELPKKSIIHVSKLGLEGDQTMSDEELERMHFEQTVTHIALSKVGIENMKRYGGAGAFMIIGQETNPNMGEFERKNAIYMNKMLESFVMALAAEQLAEKAPLKINLLNPATSQPSKDSTGAAYTAQAKWVSNTILNDTLPPSGFENAFDAWESTALTGRLHHTWLGLHQKVAKRPKVEADATDASLPPAANKAMLSFDFPFGENLKYRSQREVEMAAGRKSVTVKHFDKNGSLIGTSYERPGNRPEINSDVLHIDAAGILRGQSITQVGPQGNQVTTYYYKIGREYIPGFTAADNTPLDMQQHEPFQRLLDYKKYQGYSVRKEVGKRGNALTMFFDMHDNLLAVSELTLGSNGKKSLAHYVVHRALIPRQMRAGWDSMSKAVQQELLLQHKALAREAEYERTSTGGLEDETVRFTYHGYLEKNQAMLGTLANPPGGINLDPNLLKLRIRRDAQGIPLPVNQQPLDNIDIRGFIPVIINIVPVTGTPLILGAAEESPENERLSFEYGLDKADTRNRFADNRNPHTQLSYLN